MASFIFRSHARARKREINRGITDNVEAAAQTLVNEVRKTLLRGTRSGRLYRVPGGVRQTYRASAPGEPPAPRTGELANSYDHAPMNRYTRLVGTPLERGRHLENGTSRMQPRPHFRSTLQRHMERLQRILGREVT